MGIFRDLAYGTYVGPLPMIAIIGLVTYVVIVTSAILASGKRRFRALRRVPVWIHRWLGIFAILLATLHLLMGISAYV
jgi:hypothetical protein